MVSPIPSLQDIKKGRAVPESLRKWVVVSLPYGRGHEVMVRESMKKSFVWHTIISSYDTMEEALSVRDLINSGEKS